MKMVCLYLFDIFLSVFLCACRDTEFADTDEPYLMIKEEFLEQNFEKKMSSVTVPVETNLKNTQWAVVSDQEWCVVAQEQTSAGILISVRANEEPEVRTAVVTVRSNVENYNITVSQLGYGPAILVSPDSLTIGASAEIVKLKVTSNIPYKIKEDVDWIEEIEANASSRALVDNEHAFQVGSYSQFGENRTAVISFVNEEYGNIVASCIVVQEPEEPGTDGVVEEGDIAFKPISGKANQWQGHAVIENCWDGLAGESYYHSPYNHSPYAGTKFPVVLDFNFDGIHTLDYFVYTPRCDSEGQWGKFEVLCQTKDNSTDVSLGSFDFKESAIPTRQDLEDPVKNVTKLTFKIFSGFNDLVNVEELEFFEKNGDEAVLEKQLLNVFTDLTCSKLCEDVADKDIHSLPGYFANIAVQLRNGTYDEWEKRFRIQEYKAYSSPREWSRKLYWRAYSDLDNPTGVHVEKGQELVALVGETHGNLLYLQSIKDTELRGEKYLLKEGVSKFVMKEDGMLFLMYNVDPSLPTSKPVKVHIPLGSGHVNGYFDLEIDKTDNVYRNLIQKAEYKYFFVKGKNIMLNFHRDKLLQYQPNGIVEYIKRFDNLVSWQLELLGLEKIRPKLFNNHICAISTEGNDYMWASEGRIAFNAITAFPYIMPDDKLYENCWGPAHEIGHVHQGAITWTGCSESSNNLFSNYVTYKIGKTSSNGSALSELAKRRFDNRPFGDFLNDSDQEDTELHMRMYWQLWLYFHKCGVKKDFYPELFKKMRAYDLSDLSPGEHQMLLVKCASDVAQKNLYEFFEAWGFMTPIDQEVSQYGSPRQYKVTEQMISDVKSYTSKYHSPQPFQYIEDRKNGDMGLGDKNVGDVGYYAQFEQNVKISGTPTYEQSGQNVQVKNGKDAVAFEVWHNNLCRYFSNSFSFTVPSGLPINDCILMAVQADGERIVMSRFN